MAAFDFPAAPINGQTYSLNGVAFTWNGYGWVQQGNPAGVTAAYVDAQDALKVAKAGDTMSGGLTLGLGGTGAGSGWLTLNGGSTGLGGGIISLQKNSVNTWHVGHASIVLGTPGVDDIVFYGVASGFQLRLSAATGQLSLSSNIPSTSPTTGALTVAGGVGIAGALNTSGDIVISKESPGLFTDFSTNAGGYVGRRNGKRRWIVIPGDSTAEGGSNTGSDFYIYRYNDVGTVNDIIDSAIKIARTDGKVTLNSTVSSTSPTTGALTVAGGVGIGGALNVNTAISIFATSPILHLEGLAGGNPSVFFKLAGVVASAIYDSGAAIVVASNTALTQGMYIAHGASAWTALSDARLGYKKSARDITDALPPLDLFRLYERTDGGVELFMKAQELAELFPHVVKRGSDDPDYVPSGINDKNAWGLSYDRLGAIALAYIKQLTARVDELEFKLGE